MSETHTFVAVHPQPMKLVEKSQNLELESPTLAQAVEDTVARYLDTLADENIHDLYELVLSEVEAPLLSVLLKHTRNNQSRTAQVLGLNRGTLRKKLKKYGML